MIRRTLAVTVGAAALVAALGWAPHHPASSPTVVLTRTADVAPAPPADLPVMTPSSTTSTTAPKPEAAHVALPASTTTTVPTVVIPPAVAVRPVPAVSGHYSCTGDDNGSAECTRDAGPEHIDQTGGDDPETTRGNVDLDYGAGLKAELCADRPVFCP